MFFNSMLCTFKLSVQRHFIWHKHTLCINKKNIYSLVGIKENAVRPYGEFAKSWLRRPSAAIYQGMLAER